MKKLLMVVLVVGTVSISSRPAAGGSAFVASHATAVAAVNMTPATVFAQSSQFSGTAPGRSSTYNQRDEESRTSYRVRGGRGIGKLIGLIVAGVVGVGGWIAKSMFGDD